MSLVFAPLMIAGYLAGLSHGPKGVAIGYSTAMLLWILPALVWALRNTPISVRDMLLTASRPLASSIVAGAIALGVALVLGQGISAFSRLFIECAILFGVHSVLLLFVAGEKVFYLELLREMTGRSSADKKSLVSA